MKTSRPPRPPRHRPPAHAGAAAPGVSLARALSKLGVLSRAQAIAAILAGRVAVDGRRVLDPGHTVALDPASLTTKITLDGAPLATPDAVCYLVDKPKGVVTTRDDPQGRPTVYALLPADAPWVVPVGRLDLASTGLLLLTNDTALAAWLGDPTNGVPRTYLVTVRGRVEATTAARAEAGVAGRDDRGRLQTFAAARVIVRKASGRESHLVVELRGGKNRELRRLFAALGHEVTRLRRVAFGGLALGEVAPGGWRLVAADELAHAFPGAPRLGAAMNEPPPPDSDGGSPRRVVEGARTSC